MEYTIHRKLNNTGKHHYKLILIDLDEYPF
jgi:hypothetical protein